jgi:hypothetical protein
MVDDTLDGLERAFNSQWAEDSRFFGVLVKLGHGHYETIINSNVKFKEKLGYYKKAYNEDLTLKANTDIRIINYTFANSFDEIQKEFYVN